MKKLSLPALVVFLLAGCTSPFTVAPDPLAPGDALAIAQSSPRWGHMKKGEAVQMIQDVYRPLSRLARAKVTASSIEVVCILDYREAHPTRQVAFNWNQAKDVVAYQQDWHDGRMTYDICVRYTNEKEGGESPPTLEYGIGHTLSGHSFNAAQAADILCALYALTGKTPDAVPSKPDPHANTTAHPDRDPRPATIEFRLQRLKQLHGKGLISDGALKKKQEEILKEL